MTDIGSSSSQRLLQRNGTAQAFAVREKLDHLISGTAALWRNCNLPGSGSSGFCWIAKHWIAKHWIAKHWIAKQMSHGKISP